MSKHTPGPWRTDALQGYATEVIAADGTTVAIYDTDPIEANARLIDAAPELLEALTALEDAAGFAAIDDKRDREAVRVALEKARAAISQATGQTL